jgi:hypothetical protein
VTVRRLSARSAAAAAVGGAFIVVLLAALSCSSSSSSAGGGCPKAVDALSANIGAVTNASDISASVAKDSLLRCGGPASWKLSAGVDQIGAKIGSLGDMNDPSMSTGTALDFACSRYDPTNSTDTCKLR